MPRYHLGGDYYRDADGTLCYGAKTYVARLISNYEMMFGEKPCEKMAPLPPDEHPELDLTNFCGEDNIEKYQSLIGALQWCISLCHFDIAVAVMTLGHYQAAPRVGHLELVKHLCGYLRKYPDGAIHFRTGIPDHSEHAKKIETYDWMYSVYGDGVEELPEDMPAPKGNAVHMTSFEDANLYHDYVTGRAVTGILHMLNQTLIDWYSKRQSTVATATYGSEFVAAKMTVEQLVELRYSLRMLGVRLDGPAWMFGDIRAWLPAQLFPI